MNNYEHENLQLRIKIQKLEQELRQAQEDNKALAAQITILNALKGDLKSA